MLQRPSHFRMSRNAPLGKGLVFAGLGGFNCAGTTLFADSSGYGNNGVLTNMTPATDWQWSEELGRMALDFDGVNDYVEFPKLGLFGGATSWSVSIWGRARSYGDRNTYWHPRSERDVLIRKVFTQIEYGWYSGSGTYATVAVPPVAVWHNLVGTWDASAGVISLFLDGAVGTPAATGTPAVVSDKSTIGAQYYSGSARNVWDGQLADPLIFNRALTPSEIQQLADPSNVMLSGLILPPRRRVWPSAVVPLSLPDYADVSNESPFEDDESIATVAATGGSTPYSYAITAQSTTAGMLKVTGTLNPDATGIYTENGTYNGVPAYERSDGTYWIWFNDSAVAWVITTAKGSYAAGWYLQDDGLPVTGEYTAYNTTGTATVALYAPFAINSSTGEITITDPSGLAVGQTWTITVQVTDALTDTDTGTVTVELTAGAGVVFVRRINQRFLATGSYGAAQVQV